MSTSNKTKVLKTKKPETKLKKIKTPPTSTLKKERKINPEKIKTDMTPKSKSWNDIYTQSISKQSEFKRTKLPGLITAITIVGTTFGAFAYYFWGTDLHPMDYIFNILICLFISIPVGFALGFMIRKLVWRSDQCYTSSGVFKNECVTIRDQIALKQKTEQPVIILKSSKKSD